MVNATRVEARSNRNFALLNTNIKIGLFVNIYIYTHAHIYIFLIYNIYLTI